MKVQIQNIMKLVLLHQSLLFWGNLEEFYPTYLKSYIPVYKFAVSGPRQRKAIPPIIGKQYIQRESKNIFKKKIFFTRFNIRIYI